MLTYKILLIEEQESFPLVEEVYSLKHTWEYKATISVYCFLLREGY